MTTPLIAAAIQGDCQTLERLLECGADPNVQVQEGRTALHEAVARSHAQAAACLLTYGANHAIADDQGRLPLDPRNTTLELLHAIRQHYRRFPRRQSSAGGTASQPIEQLLQQLDRRGIVKLSGLIRPADVSTLRTDFESFVRYMQDKLRLGQGIYHNYDEEEHYWKKDRALVTNNAFKYSPQLIRICCRPPLAQIANLYLGRPAFITRGVGMRYFPSPPTNNDMFGWHHDMEEKRLKIMILLTDVGQNDQAMSYVIGSHQILHPFSMFHKNTSSVEYCRRHLSDIEIYSAAGQVGDMFLFDSNGTHRGNRRENANVRDVFLIEFTTERSDVWGGDLDPQAFDTLPLPNHHPFAWLISAEKKWTKPFTRRWPTWVENLPYPDRWL